MLLLSKKGRVQSDGNSGIGRRASGLQAWEERRGSNASQIVECCLKANLRRFATNEGEDTYDVFNSPTSYEPNAHDFDELYDSSVSFSFKIPSADQDVDDLTLGEMLTEAYRGQVDYFVQEGVSVSQSVVVVCKVR